MPLLKLETELKQKKFTTAEERAIVNIIYTAYRINDRFSCLLSSFKISIAQYNILRILRGLHPAGTSIILLKERMMDKNSGVSRLVEKLRVKGLVKCAVNSSDRRQSDVKISPAGLKILKEIDKQIVLVHQSAKILPAAQLCTLNQYLDRLRGNLISSV
jgi:DNA-binding MarR family transcriptional regulator